MCESYNLQYSANFISVMPTVIWTKCGFDLGNARNASFIIEETADNLVKDNWSLIKKI